MLEDALSLPLCVGNATLPSWYCLLPQAQLRVSRAPRAHPQPEGSRCLPQALPLGLADGRAGATGGVRAA